MNASHESNLAKFFIINNVPVTYQPILRHYFEVLVREYPDKPIVWHTWNLSNTWDDILFQESMAPAVPKSNYEYFHDGMKEIKSGCTFGLVDRSHYDEDGIRDYITVTNGNVEVF